MLQTNNKLVYSHNTKQTQTDNKLFCSYSTTENNYGCAFPRLNTDFVKIVIAEVATSEETGMECLCH